MTKNKLTGSVALATPSSSQGQVFRASTRFRENRRRSDPQNPGEDTSTGNGCKRVRETLQ